jgi:hypothetical protein
MLLGTVYNKSFFYYAKILFTTHNHHCKMKLKKLFFLLGLSASVCLASAQSSSVATNKKDKKETVASVDKKTKSTTDAAVSNTATPRIGAGSPVATIKNARTLNSDKDDFSPAFYNNGLVFCSTAKKAAKKGEDEKLDDDINLKYATFDSLGNLTKPTNFGHRANTKTNEGPSCFTAKEDTIYLSRTASKNGKVVLNKSGKATLKIYIKTRDTSGNFVGEQILPFESENYSYCHPTLSADGNRLFFSSNMPGGFGGMDLWVSRRIKDGTWSQPINLGARVNTAKNEVFPCMSEKGNLYFSTDGMPTGKGGYDLFRIEIEHRTARAFPLGEPFNTEGDDFGIMFMPKGETKGYFSSNRKGGTGGDDIYEFEFIK